MVLPAVHVEPDIAVDRHEPDTVKSPFHRRVHDAVAVDDARCDGAIGYREAIRFDIRHGPVRRERMARRQDLPAAIDVAEAQQQREHLRVAPCVRSAKLPGLRQQACSNRGVRDGEP